MEFALFRSEDAVHLLLHHRASAPTVIQTAFGPWNALGWVDADALPDPLRRQVLEDLSTQAYAVVPANDARELAELAARTRRRH